MKINIINQAVYLLQNILQRNNNPFPLCGIALTHKQITATRCQQNNSQLMLKDWWLTSPTSSAHKQTNKLADQQIATSIADSLCKYKTITLRKDQPRHIKKLLLDYLHTQNPENLCFDYQINHSKLLIVTAEKHKVTEKTEQLKNIGLTTTLVEPESHAIERYFCFLYPELQNKTFCYLSIAESEITTFVLSQFQTVYFHQQNLSDKQSLENTLLEHIAKLKQQHSFKLTTPITQFFLGGSFNELSALQDHLAALSVDIEIVNPFKQLKVYPNINSHEAYKNRAALTTSLGLSLRQQ